MTTQFVIEELEQQQERSSKTACLTSQASSHCLQWFSYLHLQGKPA